MTVKIVTDEELNCRATAQYAQEGSIEIDPTAPVSRGDGGAYVQAWVWVQLEEGEEFAPAPTPKKAR